MNDLVNLKKIWDEAVEKWRTSFGAILLAVITFFIGMQVQHKFIVDDCKFSGVFRDGAQAYSCQQVMRIPR